MWTGRFIVEIGGPDKGFGHSGKYSIDDGNIQPVVIDGKFLLHIPKI